MIKKTLSITNIIFSIILFIVLLFSEIADNFVYIMFLTLIIGWIMPYLTLLISGIAFLTESHSKLTLVFNILSFLLTLFLLLLNIKIYEKKLLILVIEYIIIGTINLLNIIYSIIFIKKNFDPEIVQIKESKKKNNGAIV